MRLPAPTTRISGLVRKGPAGHGAMARASVNVGGGPSAGPELGGGGQQPEGRCGDSVLNTVPVSASLGGGGSAPELESEASGLAPTTCPAPGPCETCSRQLSAAAGVPPRAVTRPRPLPVACEAVGGRSPGPEVWRAVEDSRAGGAARRRRWWRWCCQWQEGSESRASRACCPRFPSQESRGWQAMSVSGGRVRAARA
jgi:hypothetical protein